MAVPCLRPFAPHARAAAIAKGCTHPARFCIPRMAIPMATRQRSQYGKPDTIGVQSTGMERIDRSATLSQEGLPGRYAAALFDLALAAKALDDIAGALDAMKAAIAQSEDFAAFVQSPRIRRRDAAAAITAVAAEMQLPKLAADFLAVVAGNGRLSLLPAIIAAFGRMVSRHKGNSAATVTSAQPLSAAQQKALTAKLKARTGRAMDLDLVVDPAILGGLIVRIGSEQIDASVRTRLDRLGQQMKGL